jgi:hypothetical protein
VGRSLNLCHWTISSPPVAGYGNLVPVTWKGRMFCVSYALFGVPLILITVRDASNRNLGVAVKVADIGKFLSENIVWLYTRYAKAKRRCRTPTAPSISDDSASNRGPRVKDQLMQVRGSSESGTAIDFLPSTQIDHPNFSSVSSTTSPFPSR